MLVGRVPEVGIMLAVLTYMALVARPDLFGCPELWWYAEMALA